MLNDIYLKTINIDTKTHNLDVQKESLRSSTTTTTITATASGTSSYSGLEDKVVGTSLASPLAAWFLLFMAISPSRLSTRSSAQRQCIGDKEEQQYQVFI